MGRNATPRKLQEVKPDFKINAHRYRNKPPQAQGQLKPPAHFDATHKKLWKEIIEHCPKDVTEGSDLYILELMTNLIYTMRYAPEDFNGTHAGKLLSCLSKMGMTPSDRVSMANKGFNAEEEHDEFGDF